MTAGVVTGEAVALDVRLAHWPSRLLGFVIDAVAQFFLLLFLNLAVARALENQDSDLQLAGALVVIVTVVFGYPIAFETFWRGRTPGKAAIGLRVVRDDGAPERFRHAVARALLMPFECWGLALLVSVISERSKRIGDMLAGTVVVQQRVPGARTSLAVAMPPQLAQWASVLDLSRVSDELALSCRQFLGRQHELHPGARDAMGTQLVAAVQAVVSPPPPPGTPGWAYLSAVVAERRRRDEWRMWTASQQHRTPQPPYPAPQPSSQPAPPPTSMPTPPPGPFAPPQ
jgi:uncharacterized RDD family membrane protein YckC